MSKPKLDSPLDYPPIWRSLIKRLNTVAGVVGCYAEIHDARVIHEFCDAFKIPVSDVSARLEAYCHACHDAVN
jgi:hypothetical protein